jgi:hypothetical protein
MERYPGAQQLIGPDFVEINVKYLAVQNIPLGVLNKGIHSLTVNINLNNSTFGNSLYTRGKFQGIKIDGYRVAGTPIDNRRDTPGLPYPAGVA